MAAEDLETLGMMNYYLVEGYYRHVQVAVLDATRRYGTDDVLTLYKGISMMFEGQSQEAIRELTLIKDKPTVDLAALAVLIEANKENDTAVASYQATLQEGKKRANDMQLYLLATMEWHLHHTRSAKENIETLLKRSEGFKQGLVLRGWIELSSGREMGLKKALRFLDAGLSQNNKDPFGFIGKERCLIKAKKFSHAMEAVNQAVVSFPNFIPAYVERMRVFLALMNWDQMLESAHKLLSLKSHHPEALIHQILSSISQHGQYSEAINRLSELIQIIDRFEPHNATLYFKCGQLFSRMASRNVQVLNQTNTLVERAMSLDGNNVEYAIEHAKHIFLMADADDFIQGEKFVGKMKEANAMFKKCMQMDESSVQALLGLLRCQLAGMEELRHVDRAELKDIQDQLDFLTEIKDANFIDAELLYLKAVHGRISGTQSSQLVDLIENARVSHFKQTHNLVLGSDYFLRLNPDFLMSLVHELLQLVPSQPLLPGEVLTPALKCCEMILSTLIQVTPGLIIALYSRARTLFLSGDNDEAMVMLNHCLEMDVTYGPAHLLMAEIHQNQGNHAATAKYLDAALSYNFEIREHPKYHLIKAKTQIKADQMDEAVQTLKLAMSLPGVNRPVSAATLNKRGKKPVAKVETGDRLSLFLELAKAHSLKQEHHEAAKVMQDAINAFQGTPEEVRVKIANAELSLSRGDVELSLTVLRGITKNQPYYVQAKQKMADIYLHHRKDKQLYTSCYREMYDSAPSTHTAVMLGDAYMKLSEPEHAVRVYEVALKKNPRDGTLASKVGQALVYTHDYKRAITYYESAVNNGQKSLRFELALLLLRLKNFDKAERVLQPEAEPEETERGLEWSVTETRRLLLLATMYRDTNRHDLELQTLKAARDMQARVLKRAQIEQPDASSEQKKIASEICTRLAHHSRTVENNQDQAIKYHKEALVYCDGSVKTMLELAKLYLQQGDTDGCTQYCTQVLRRCQSGNDQASMMLADVMFDKKQYQDAIYHYQQLLAQKPNNYEAMARLVGLLRRGGKLADVPALLKSAEEQTGEGRAAQDAGFQYCKGIYEWYCGHAVDALRLLNRARCDTQWSEKALELMIRICLNPDQLTLGGEVFESLSENSSDAAAENALSTAERLVKEFKSSDDPYKVQVLECLVLAATKQKTNAERAISVLTEICQKKRDYVPALLAMAIAYQVLKQTPRARNQLKRISKMPWTTEDGDDFESAWLLLSDMYVTAGKYDMATELLKNCLEHNKSCCQAYEYLGFIYEKEQSYKDAAEYYEVAWKHQNESNPVIGYKLAFNYLKAKRNVDAINVSHKVLAANPDYPRMKKEILDKARASLRI